MTNSVPGKQIALRTAHSTVLGENFTARVEPGPGEVRSESDLPGLT